MTGHYTTVCPYCHIQVHGTAPRGIFEAVADAAKALDAHLRDHCTMAPKLKTRERQWVIAANIHDIGEGV